MKPDNKMPILLRNKIVCCPPHRLVGGYIWSARRYRRIVRNLAEEQGNLSPSSWIYADFFLKARTLGRLLNPVVTAVVGLIKKPLETRVSIRPHRRPGGEGDLRSFSKRGPEVGRLRNFIVIF